MVTSKSKIDKHVHEYDLFQMKDGERIEEMFERFSKIINSLDSLGKPYEAGDIVRKILMCPSMIKELVNGGMTLWCKSIGI